MRELNMSGVIILGLLLAFGLTVSCTKAAPEPEVVEVTAPAPVGEASPAEAPEGEEQVQEEAEEVVAEEENPAAE